MRVLFLNHNVIGSGTFNRAFPFGRQLAARGHEVTMVTTSSNARFTSRSYEREGVEMIEAPDLMSGRARTGWDPYNTQVRKLLVSRRSYDVVHAFDSRPAVVYPALAAVKKSNALFVMDWADWWGRGGWIEERSSWLVRKTFGPVETWFEEAFRARAHGLTVISHALGNRSRGLGIADDRIERIPQGCEFGEPGGTRPEARTRLGIARDAAVILHVGVLTPGDYAFLTTAFERLRRVTPSAYLVLAGRTGMIIPRARPENVIVTGSIETVTLSAWVAAANVCVIPCRDTIGNRGRWPSKLSEYLSSGRAVVMPRVGDAAELIERARAGWTTNPTVEDFAHGMSAAVANPAQADEAGMRGRAAAELELGWPQLTDQLVAFYDRLGNMI